MNNIKNVILITSYITLVTATTSSNVYADDVTDSINEGLQYYKDGKHTDAAASLNYASQLIQQKKGGSIKSLLPAPLKGWKAQDARSETAGAAFGAGISVEREYNKGSSSVTIQIVADSPMLQGLMMMFSNPMFAQSDGGKLQKISGQKAIIKYDTAYKNGEIQVIVANRFLVTIRGDDVSEENIIDYAKALDYKKIAELP